MRSFVVLSLVCLASTAARAQQETIILHNAALVDGTGATARQHVDIYMHKGYIEHVGPAFTKPPKKTTVVDCTGKTVIPGLISAHSHLGILLNNADPSPTAYTAENATAATLSVCPSMLRMRAPVPTSKWAIRWSANAASTFVP